MLNVESSDWFCAQIAVLSNVAVVCLARQWIMAIMCHLLKQ